MRSSLHQMTLEGADISSVAKRINTGGTDIQLEDLRRSGVTGRVLLLVLWSAFVTTVIIPKCRSYVNKQRH